MRYKVVITREDGLSVAEGTLSPDQVIVFLLMNAPDERTRPVAEQLGRDLIRRMPLDLSDASEEKGKTRRAYRCSVCGEANHTARSCPGKKSSFEVNATPDWYRDEILRMVRDGESDHDIYVAMSDRITDAQYRETLAWAKKEELNN